MTADSSHDASLSAISAALRDRYRFEREIGAGNMATVYLASDLKHDRPVAVKVLRGGETAVDVERFHREIRVLARLRHPFILPLHDSGEAAGAGKCTTRVSRGLLPASPAFGSRRSCSSCLGSTSAVCLLTCLNVISSSAKHLGT